MRVFVAGAAGALGVRLVPQLVERGHQVTASTRQPAKVALLRSLGADPVVMDGLDAGTVGEAVTRAEPEVVVHQMTALAGKADLRHFDRWFATTNRLRTTGTENLLAAATAAGATRLVVQSYVGWNNSRVGGPVKSEDDPLDPHPARAQVEALAAIRYVEDR
jgi:nucleoside-diphosphate-sugar epimerase